MCLDEDEPFTNQEVADIVYDEGLGYAVTDYLAAESIADPELADLWKDATEALGRISKFLADYPVE